ncbi:MAG TPA: phosphonate ABC transporter, permease protein PhnE [Spirochaetia bacterium]
MARKPAVKTEKPSLVPPWTAAVVSLLVPGLGQVLARAVWRGILVLFSMAAIVGMLVWRIDVIGHLQTTPAAKLAKALELQPGFTILLVVVIAVIWLWNAWDARLVAKNGRGGFTMLTLILLAFFVLGWQISEINPKKLVTDFPQAMRPLGMVIWPWQAAIVQDPIQSIAGASIMVPTAPDGGPPPDPVVEGKPHVAAEPRTGELSRMDDNNNLVPGTTLTLTGTGFKPGIPVAIWWIDPLGNAFQVRRAGKYLALMPDDTGSFTIDFPMPYNLGPQVQGKDQPHRVEARQTIGLSPVRASEPLIIVIQRMVETIFMGMMATLFGIILSIPVSFLAARNIMSGSPVLVGIYYVTRTILNIVRAIEPLIWALIAVVWVGLGPFAGIVALTVHSVAALGKLYSEAIEGIDSGPIEAIQATGATRLQTIMYAVVPQMISPFVSFSIYRWDVNVRMSTVIGLVGGGGVGFILVQYIRLLDYRAAGIAVWFIAVTVAILDYVSAEIRARFV